MLLDSFLFLERGVFSAVIVKMPGKIQMIDIDQIAPKGVLYSGCFRELQ